MNAAHPENKARRTIMFELFRWLKPAWDSGVVSPGRVVRAEEQVEGWPPGSWITWRSK